jgi:hypothetical protein
MRFVPENLLRGANAKMPAALGRGPTFPPPRPLRYSLLTSVVVIIAPAFGAVVLYAATEALRLIVHQAVQ